MNPEAPDTQGSNSVSELSHEKTESAQYFTTNQRAFLAAYARLGTIIHAATAAGIDRRNHGVWLTDPAYKRAFLEAKEEAAEYLEGEARRRAVEGVEEPDGWWYDKELNCFKPKGTIKRYSDTLLIFLMKGAMPDKYRERVENTNLLKVDPNSLTEEQLKVLAEAFLKDIVGDDPQQFERARRELESGNVVINATSERVEDEPASTPSNESIDERKTEDWEP